jgi:hypothetical protein
VGVEGAVAEELGHCGTGSEKQKELKPWKWKRQWKRNRKCWSEWIEEAILGVIEEGM